MKNILNKITVIAIKIFIVIFSLVPASLSAALSVVFIEMVEGNDDYPRDKYSGITTIIIVVGIFLGTAAIISSLLIKEYNEKRQSNKIKTAPHI
jgi:hypothetical protein